MFSDSTVYLGNFEAILFARPEKRWLYGLPTLLKCGTLKRAWIANFRDYDELQPSDLSAIDKAALASYHENLEKLTEWGVTNAESVSKFNLRLNKLNFFDI